MTRMAPRLAPAEQRMVRRDDDAMRRSAALPRGSLPGLREGRKCQFQRFFGRHGRAAPRIAPLNFCQTEDVMGSSQPKLQTERRPSERHSE